MIPRTSLLSVGAVAVLAGGAFARLQQVDKTAAHSASVAASPNVTPRVMVVSVDPDGGTANVPSETDTEVLFFVSASGLTGPNEYSMTIENCNGSGLAGPCTLSPSSVVLDPNISSASVAVRFRSASSGNVVVELRARHVSNLFDTDQGSINATVVTPSVSVSANTPNVTVPPLSMQTAQFTVSNPGVVPSTINLSGGPGGSCPPQVFKVCNIVPPFTFTLSPFASQIVNVDYQTNQPSQSGPLSLHASVVNLNPPVEASATTTVTTTAGTPAVAVTPDGGTSSAGPNTASSVTFSVQNTGTAVLNLNFSASCTPAGFATCGTITPSSLTMNPDIPFPAAQNVTVNFTTGSGNPSSGQVTLTATATGTNPLVQDNGSYTVTINVPRVVDVIAPTPSSVTLAPNTASSTTFTVNNPTVIPDTVNLSTSCTGVPNAIASCPTPSPSQIIVPANSSSPVTLNLTSGSTNGATGTVQLTAALIFPNLSVTDNASFSVTVQQAAGSVAVTPDNAPITRTVNTTTSETFQVQNTGGSSNTYSLSASCTGVTFSQCNLSQASITLGPGASGSVSVTHRPTATGPGTITVSASGSGGGTDNGSYSVTVQAAGGSVAVTPDNAAITRAVNTTVSDTFRVRNTGSSSSTYTLSASCTGVTFAQCSVSRTSITLGAGASDTVSITHRPTTTGAGTIAVTATGGGSDNGSYAVNVAAQVMSTQLSSMDGGLKQIGRCAASCFAARHALTTVPYYSLGQARSVTLAYDGDQLAVRPIVSADMSLPAGAPALAEYRLSARDSAGAAITFVNGETVMRFAPPPGGSTNAHRISAQFDAAARNWSTGEHNLTLFITARFPNGYVEHDTITTPLVVVNERQSYIARGWTVAGLQRVYTFGNTRLITEGDGSVYKFTNCSPVCNNVTGDVSRVTVTGSGTIREYPDSSRVEFNLLGGRMIRHITRTLDTTVFAYDGQGRLELIYDPFRGGALRLSTLLTYGANGLLQSITEPGPNQQVFGGRVTTLGIAADSTLQSWTDPGGVSTQLRYDAQKRLQHVINRRGDTTTIAYNAMTWKLDNIQAPSIPVDPRLFPGNQTRRLTSTFRPWLTLAVPTAATASTPWPSVRTDTVRGVVTAPGSLVSAFTVDGWGQAIETTVNPGTPLQQITRVFKSPITPYADSVRYHTGAVDRFRFNISSGLLEMQRLAGQDSVRIAYQAFAQPQQISGPRRPTITYIIGPRGRIDSENYAGITTQYAYDARHRVIRVTDPGNHADSLFYESIFGQLDRTARPGNRVTTILYDGFGRDTLTTTAPLSPQGTEYDVINRVTETRNNAVFGFSADSTRYAHDNLFPTTITSHVTAQPNQVFTLQHNALGAQTVETDPAGTSQRFFYNDRGLGTLRLNARGDSIITTYDPLHRPSIVTLKRGSAVVRADSFFYDPAGRIVVGSNKHSRDSLYVSASGWTDSVVTRFATDTSKRIRILYRKDTTERLIEVSPLYPSGIASTTRQLFWSDTRDVLDSIKIAGQKVSLSYDGELLLAALTQPGNVQRTHQRTTSHNEFSWSFTPPAIDTLLNRTARFDTLGRVRSASRPFGAIDRFVTTYMYDARGRLTHAADTLHDRSSSCTPIVDPSYGILQEQCPVTNKVAATYSQVTHDEVGNIVFNDGPTVTGLPTYSSNRITSWPGGFTYATDADGNVVTRTPPSGAPANFFWSPDGLLDSVRVGSARKVYGYNAFGMLVRLWEGAGALPQRHYVWDQGHLLIELNGALTQRRGEYAYLPGTDRPIALLTGPTTLTARRYLYQDVQGSVIGAVFDNGTMWRYQTSSDPWSSSGGGFIGAWSGAGFLPDTMALRWQGLLWESSLGGNALYYARARWYDPRTKRFMSPDPLGVAAGVNPYVFGNNDPLNLSDATGLQTDADRCRRVVSIVTTTSGGFTYETEEVAYYCERSSRGGSTQTLPPLSIGYGVKVPPASVRNRAPAEQACYVREFEQNKQRTRHLLDAGAALGLSFALAPLYTFGTRTTGSLTVVLSAADNAIGTVISNSVATSLGVPAPYGQWNPTVRLRGIPMTGALSATRVLVRNTAYGALASYGVEFAALMYSVAAAEAACASVR